MSPREERWVIKELVKGLGGKEWWVVRDLKDFHASSVSLVMRDLWRVVWSAETWSGVRERDCGGQVGSFWGSSSKLGDWCC